jgi:hypothetical protein
MSDTIPETEPPELTEITAILDALRAKLYTDFQDISVNYPARVALLEGNLTRLDGMFDGTSDPKTQLDIARTRQIVSADLAALRSAQVEGYYTSYKPLLLLFEKAKLDAAAGSIVDDTQHPKNPGNTVSPDMKAFLESVTKQQGVHDADA